MCYCSATKMMMCRLMIEHYPVEYLTLWLQRIVLKMSEYPVQPYLQLHWNTILNLAHEPIGWDLNWQPSGL